MVEFCHWNQTRIKQWPGSLYDYTQGTVGYDTPFLFSQKQWKKKKSFQKTSAEKNLAKFTWETTKNVLIHVLLLMRYRV